MHEQTLDLTDKREFSTKLYKRRWLMLVLYILSSVTSSVQYLEYSTISNIVSKYYNVSRQVSDLTTIASLVGYTVLFMPVLAVLDKLNLKTMIILGCSTSCLGAWIKTFSVSSDRFYILVLGQFVTSLNQPFRLPLPGRLAAKWFGENEKSTATALGIYGLHLGILISFVLSPSIVKNHEDLDNIGRDLTRLAWILAIATTISLASVVLFFQDEPTLPPSRTRALQKSRDQVDESLMAPLGRLLVNKQLLQLLNSYGLVVAHLGGFILLLNQLYLTHFKDSEEVGRIGVCNQISGMIGSVLCGIFLDKTHKFKEVAVTVIAGCLCSQLVFSAALIVEIKPIIYLAAGVYGFFVFSYMADSYEIGIEFTYPENEIFATSLLEASYNLYSFILLLILGELMNNFGEMAVHITMAITLLLALINTALTKDVKKRQDASVIDVDDFQCQPFRLSDAVERK